MRWAAAWLVGAMSVAACSVRAPAPIDVLALTRAEGSEGARQVLVAQVLAHPRDVQARLALAALAERLGRPGEAIAQLDEVVALGGPAGVRWHPDDRARLARLLHVRGLARLARGAASAEADLDRAAKLGARVAPADTLHARAAGALAKLRHADAGERAGGRRVLGELASAPGADPAWRGARPAATPEERAALGVFLWTAGARRAAYDELAGVTPRAPAIQAAYLRALAWWSPVWLGDVPPPPASELSGPERCRFATAACAAHEAIGTAAADPLAASPIGARTADPDDALAWLDLSLRAALRGDATWGTALRARVDVAAVSRDPRLSAEARGLFASFGQPPPAVPAQPASRLSPLVTAAMRILAGASAADVRDALGAEAATPDGAALLAIVAPPPPPPAALDASADLRAAAVARYVRARVADAPPPAALIAIARAYRRDPTSAERLAREAVDAAPDAAAASAAMGAAFDALGDPARARAAWQVAADASREPAFLAGLAEATARANDPDAALIQVTAAAAASGDPAVEWVALARALVSAGAAQQGLTAAHAALDLAGPDALPAALDIAVTASRALGRDAQADALAAQRARLAPAVASASAGATDPTDATAALVELARTPGVSAVAHLWVATRWNPRDVASRIALVRALPADDARVRAIQLELVTLAADPDAPRARAAAQALP